MTMKLYKLLGEMSEQLNQADEELFEDKSIDDLDDFEKRVSGELYELCELIRNLRTLLRKES